MIAQIIFFALALSFSVVYVTRFSLLLSQNPEFEERISILGLNIVGYLAVVSWTVLYALSLV